MGIAEEWRKLQSVKRVVVKVGTSTLTYETGNLNLPRMEILVRQLVDLKNQGRDVILVTSAAVGAGMGRLNISERPAEISSRQALAAIGQGILMHIYEKFFSEYGVAVAQVLLTKDDLADRHRFLNARTTLRQIMTYGAVPIINENDTVAFDQIRVGDNDTLAAMVAGLVDADLLVLLSDVDGLYTGDPRKDANAQWIPVVEGITPEIEAIAGGEGSRLGSGGMATKIAAARISVTQGIPMVLTNGSRKDCMDFLSCDVPQEDPSAAAIPTAGTSAEGRSTAGMSGGRESADEKVVGGKAIGNGGNRPGCTLFLPKERSLGSRKGWLAFSTRPSGVVYVDAGAKTALLENGKSLLPSGVLDVEGGFIRGEVVEIRQGSSIIARGITNYSAEDMAMIKGKHSSEIEGILGPGMEQEVIHRDNLSAWV